MNHIETLKLVRALFRHIERTQPQLILTADISPNEADAALTAAIADMEELQRLKQLIEDSEMEEKPVHTCIDGCSLVDKGETRLFSKHEAARQQQRTKDLQKMASMARELAAMKGDA